MKKTSLLLVIIQFCILVSGQEQTVLNVNVNDMLYDESRNKIFAVISSLDLMYGNKLIQIDCDSKTIENSIFVGSDPVLIDITSDNNFLYIALEGSPKIVRVDVNSFQIDLQFPIGPMGVYVDVLAKSIETIPDKPNQVAVCREGDYDDDVVIFDNGTLLPDSFGIYYIEITEIETDSTGSVLYGVDGDKFLRFQITPSGITYIDEYDGVISGSYYLKMNYLNGLIYTDGGQVVNPHLSIPFIEGTFSGINTQYKMTLNELLKESYFGVIDHSPIIFIAKRYNLETYALKETKEISIDFPESMYIPELSEFICYGNNKFVISAFETYSPEDNENYIIFIDSLYSDSSATITGYDLYKNISVFPNPASNFVNVELPFDGVSQIKIINSFGIEVYSIKIKRSSNVKIDVSGFDSGFYFLNITNKDQVINKKIIKN